MRTQLAMRRGGSAKAFTLVELLVVITIIIILAGLISVAAALAIGTAKQTRIANEVQMMDAALKKMAGDYGFSTIPDFTYSNATPNPLAGWFGKAFTRSQDLLPTGTSSSGNYPGPDQMLYILLMGFSTDPLHPMTGDGGPCSPTWGKFKKFEFDQNRLKNPVLMSSFSYFSSFPGAASVYVYQYLPLDTLQAPYCLFSSLSYQPNSAATPITKSYSGPGLASYPPPWSTSSFPFSGIARPYFSQYNSSGTTTFCNPTTFQIISGGLDDDYGTAPVSSPLLFPSGANYTDGDRDNVTNFSQGTLGVSVQ